MELLTASISSNRSHAGIRRCLSWLHRFPGTPKRASHLRLLILIILGISRVLAQTTNERTSDAVTAEKSWSFLFSTSGYLIPNGQSYASPTLSADHRHLHLEARYNNEAQQTGSLWAGFNLKTGDKLMLEITPIVGVVFGDMTGVAPGCEVELTYKKVKLSSQMEFVFDTAERNNSFFYSWNELVYSPVDWFHAGLVSQRTRAYHTDLDIQRGFSAGITHKSVDFTTFVFNAGWTTPTVVLALSFRY